MRAVHSAIWVTVAAAAGLALAAGPAEAGRGGTCASGRVCLYENNWYNRENTDHFLDFIHDDDDFANNVWWGTNDTMEDETSSLKNRFGCAVVLYQHPGTTGVSTTFGDVNDGFLSNNVIGDNRASSLNIVC